MTGDVQTRRDPSLWLQIEIDRLLLLLLLSHPVCTVHCMCVYFFECIRKPLPVATTGNSCREEGTVYY